MSNAPLRLAFAGTPEIAATILDSLLQSADLTVERIYTQPDKPAGRGRKLHASPVKRLALAHGLAVKQPGNAAALAADESLAEDDVMVVVAYGMILPATVLHRPRAGCINIHPSLLPRWRGAAPIQRAIQHGDQQTGISIIQMDEGIDTGAILLQSCCPIRPDDTAASLHEKLAGLGSDCLLEALRRLQQNRLSAKAQGETGACHAARISKAEAEINWHATAAEIDQLIRAFNPAPVAFTQIAGKTLRVWQAVVCETGPIDVAPGSIVGYTRAGLEIACRDGIVRITRLQLPGKKAQAIDDFHNGQPQLFNH